MNSLPLEIENIIYSYLHQLNFTKVLDEIKEEIIEYQNPESMNEMWGNNRFTHGELKTMKTPRGKIKWCRDLSYGNFPSTFNKSEWRFQCEDCGLNINHSCVKYYPECFQCYECDKWYCGCENKYECCED